MGDTDDSPDTDESELIRRLRRRADELRAVGTPRLVDTPEPEAGQDLPGPDHDLLARWADEEHLGTESPERNRAPLYVSLAVVAVVAALVLVFRFATGGDAGGGAETNGSGGDREAPSVTDADPPTLDDLTSEVTVPPGPDEGLVVADQGVTIVEDRFDPEEREGTFAAIIRNPHPDWLAQGVQVEVEFLDENGRVVGGDRAFLEVILPEQRVAVGALFFDAPTVPISGMNVELDVARWRESGPADGELATAEVVTEEAEFSGLRTMFVLRSSFDEALTEVGVTAVYRDEAGRIVGGADTFLDLVEPATDTPGELSLLANIDVGRIDATELYPSVGFGFVPDE